MLFSLLHVSAFILFIFFYIKLNKWYRRERVDEFHKKSVFVTGTDHGFGNLLVTKLDKMGLKVYAGCFTKEGAEKLREISSERVKPIMIDVTKRETMLAARDFVEKDLEPNEGLWGLVNNAGIVRGILFDFCRLDDYIECMEVNFFGVITTTEIFMPLIKKSRGRIVNVSSMSGRISVGAKSYSGSKHALEVYSNGLRRSMKTFGVHTAIIEPGFFQTPMSTAELWESEMDRTWNNLPSDLKEDYGRDYKDFMTKYMLEMNTKTPFQNLNKHELVINAMIHGLSSKRPKARYPVGFDAILYKSIFTVAPDWFFDSGMRKQLHYEKIPVKNSH